MCGKTGNFWARGRMPYKQSQRGVGEVGSGNVAGVARKWDSKVFRALLGELSIHPNFGFV